MPRVGPDPAATICGEVEQEEDVGGSRRFSSLPVFWAYGGSQDELLKSPNAPDDPLAGPSGG